MPRYKLTIAYDGTDFCGWQKQEPPDPAHADRPSPHPRTPEALLDPSLTPKPGRLALRTVQAVLEETVRQVIREPVIVTGASRTDSGVHARGQVAAFTSAPDPARGVGWPEERGTDTLLRALNSRLPDDLLVTGVEIVPESFDPIADPVSKGYSYSIHQGPSRPIWTRRLVTHERTRLDTDAMQRAASKFVGERDFAAFAAAGHGRRSTVRTVHACTVTVRDATPDPGTIVRIDISGNGFLYNMVRIIAGTLSEVGRGRIEPDAVEGIIAGRDRSRAGPTMPPEGLCLEWIEYPPCPNDSRDRPKPPSTASTP